MKNEPFIELFIEFAPFEFRGAVLWLPESIDSLATVEGEVMPETTFPFL